MDCCERASKPVLKAGRFASRLLVHVCLAKASVSGRSTDTTSTVATQMDYPYCNTDTRLGAHDPCKDQR
eukprot:scaffold66507_cov37-Prasinocladus_malaysianus.AAC.2